MRKDTLRLCEFAVGGLENTYLDNPDELPISLTEAIDYCYDEFIDATGNRGMGNTTAIFFDTKNAIKEEIRKIILQSEFIKIKEE